MCPPGDKPCEYNNTKLTLLWTRDIFQHKKKVKQRQNNVFLILKKHDVQAGVATHDSGATTENVKVSVFYSVVFCTDKQIIFYHFDNLFITGKMKWNYVSDGVKVNGLT